MCNISFDQDSYEKDLALIMLETLSKNNTIGLNTYRATKKRLGEKEVPDERSGSAERTAEVAV